MIDRDLAELYEVKTFRLNEQVKRNAKRFPEDFMFQLKKEEADSLRSQFETLKRERTSSLTSQFAISSSWGGRRSLPYAFTEQGIAMLSSVLNSDRAIEVNIQIMRTFTKLREMMMTHKDLAQRIEALERKFRDHDDNFTVVFKAIRQLLEPLNSKEKEQIGFKQ